MKPHCNIQKTSLLRGASKLKGLWFHIIGLACLIWFLIRVVPAPHRYQYPCQQVSIPIALGYIAFWSVLFHGLLLWIRKVKLKTAAVVPTVLVVCIILFSIVGIVFADTYLSNDSSLEPWDPIPKDPIGTPRGVNPGRVVWVWNPDATESDPCSYWWKKENNDQQVTDTMFSTGMQGLTGEDSDYTAWDILFKHFNEMHGYGDIGYQSGEKIAIKINLNNCWVLRKNPYLNRDNERDASPYVVKTLLKQLIDAVGVSQENIIVYDASRQMANWFYNRVYYETYPAIPLIPEFPDVNYIDSEGGALGRQKVEASTQRIYFADDTGLYRTLPRCVVDAKYIINIPLLKRHPIEQGVTLSGKNLSHSLTETF